MPAIVSVRRFLSAIGDVMLATVSVYPSACVGFAMRFHRDIR